MLWEQNIVPDGYGTFTDDNGFGTGRNRKLLVFLSVSQARILMLLLF